MNLNIYKALLLIPAAALFGCSDKGSGKSSDAECKSVYVKINGYTDTRTVEPTASDTTAELYTALVYFVGGESDPIIYSVLTAGPDDDITLAELEEGYLAEDIDSSVTQVYVVGNYNSVDQDGNGPTFPTNIGGRLSSVKRVVLDIQEVSYPALSGGISSTRLLTVMDGQSTLQSYGAMPGGWTGTADLTSTDMYASVTISPLVARIEIEEINYTGTYSSLTLAGIFINYYYTELPVSLDPSGYAPINNGSNVNLYDDTNPLFEYSYYTTLYDLPDITVTPAGSATFTPGTDLVWAYQVFGNVTPVPHIILKFTGIETGDGTEIENLYLTVTGFSRGGTELSTLERNTVYKIASIPFTDSDLGVLPEPDTIDLYVNVEVEPWSTVFVTPII